jgi:hypothetical protein
MSMKPGMFREFLSKDFYALNSCLFFPYFSFGLLGRGIFSISA